MQQQHDKVVTYVNSPIGTSAAALSAARAVVEDVPIIDFINYVQADAVKAGLTGADARCRCCRSPRRSTGRRRSRPGEVTVRDVAGLYIYDNTLLGVKVTGAQVKDYLEFSARYFKQVSGPGPFTMDQVTNAVTETAPNGTPDYNFDSVAGLDAPLTYDIDIAQPVGSRIAQPLVRRRAGRRRPGVRAGGQQLPPVAAAAASRTSRRRPVRLQPRRSRSASCSSTG